MPFFQATTWKGPLPMIGGLLAKLVWAACGEMWDQMCWGRMGMKRYSMSALGREQTICTVVGSRALAELMPTVETAMLAIWLWTM